MGKQGTGKWLSGSKTVRGRETEGNFHRVPFHSLSCSNCVNISQIQAFKFFLSIMDVLENIFFKYNVFQIFLLPLFLLEDPRNFLYPSLVSLKMKVKLCIFLIPRPKNGSEETSHDLFQP